MGRNKIYLTEEERQKHKLEYQKAYYDQHKEKAIRNSKVYYAQHKDKQAQYNRKYYQKNENMILEQKKQSYLEKQLSKHMEKLGVNLKEIGLADEEIDALFLES